MSWKSEKGRSRHRELRKEKRTKALNFLGGKCKRCGFSDYRALQIDHVNGNGYRERRSGNCESVYVELYKNPDKFQLLCANCNWIKKFENNETKNRIDS